MLFRAAPACPYLWWSIWAAGELQLAYSLPQRLDRPACMCMVHLSGWFESETSMGSSPEPPAVSPARRRKSCGEGQRKKVLIAGQPACQIFPPPPQESCKLDVVILTSVGPRGQPNALRHQLTSGAPSVRWLTNQQQQQKKKERGLSLRSAAEPVVVRLSGQISDSRREAPRSKEIRGNTDKGGFNDISSQFLHGPDFHVACLVCDEHMHMATRRFAFHIPSWAVLRWICCTLLTSSHEVRCRLCHPLYSPSVILLKQSARQAWDQDYLPGSDASIGKGVPRPHKTCLRPWKYTQ